MFIATYPGGGNIDSSLFPDSITIYSGADVQSGTRYCHNSFSIPTFGVYTKAKLSTTGTRRTPLDSNFFIIVHKKDGTSTKYISSSNSTVIDISDSVYVTGYLYATGSSYTTNSVILTKS